MTLAADKAGEPMLRAEERSAALVAMMVLAPRPAIDRAACWPTRNPTVGSDEQYPLHYVRVEIHERTAGASAFIDERVGDVKTGIECRKETLHVVAVRCMASECLAANLRRHAGEFARVAGGEGDAPSN